MFEKTTLKKVNASVHKRPFAFVSQVVYLVVSEERCGDIYTVFTGSLVGWLLCSFLRPDLTLLALDKGDDGTPAGLSTLAVKRGHPS